jgi:hypothetical protein
MTRRTRHLLLTLGSVLLFISLILPASWAGPSVRKEGKFWVCETPHYLIKTDVSADFAPDIGEQMESCYASYMKFARGTPKFAGKSTIVVFKRKADYLNKFQGSRERAEGSLAFYTPTTKELVSYLEGHGEDDIFNYLRHEGIHQLFDKWVGDVVLPWANEGMAYYFYYSFKEGKNYVHGFVPKSDVALLKLAFEGSKVSFISARDLMLMSWERWARNEATNPMRAYLQSVESRLFMQFLLGKKEYSRMLDAYILACSKGADAEQALRVAFGAKLDSVIKAWMEYMKQIKPYTPESCWLNLHYLGTLLRIYMDNGVKVDSPAALLEAVKTNKSITWWIREIGGGPDDKITQNDLDVVQKWFHCPKEKRLEGCSYEFVKSESKCGYPDIVCRNHGSTMLRASIVPAEEKDKKRTVVLEEPLRKK